MVTKHSPGLPLAQGLRVVGGAKGLTGWQVAAKKGHRQRVPLGTVQQVDSVHPVGQRAPAYQLLRVVQTAVLQPYGFKGQEVHLLPLVPDIITTLHPEQQLLVADPPEGLLDMGRRDLVLSFLSNALLPYAPLAEGGPTSAAGLMAGARALTQLREMPTRQALLDAGRADLVNLVLKVGGFTQAALQLGMRATRRPAGYWSSLEVLDMELDAYIAGCWVALPCPEDDDMDSEDLQQQQQQQQDQQPRQAQDVYYYNTATKSIRWSLPDELQALLAPAHTANPANPAAATAAEATAFAAAAPSVSPSAAAGLSPAAYQALLDLHEERVMPPGSAIIAAGRWDLHNAITRNGGYTQVAAELDRRLSRALPPELTAPEGVKAALREVSWEEGWDPEALPTAQQLRDADRTDLIRAISQLGGWRAAAQTLNLTNAQSTPTAWRSWTLEDLAQELSKFMAQQSSTGQATGPASPPPPAAADGEGSGSSSDPANAAGSRRRLSGIVRRRRQQAASNGQGAGTQQQSPEGQGQSSLGTLASKQQQQQQHKLQQLGAGSLPYLPTQAQLLAAGREDLVYALRQHGYEAVRRHMALPARYSRPKQKGVLQWAQVEAAVAAGCHTCKDILQHISTRHQTLKQQQQLTAAQAHEQQPMLGGQDSSSSSTATAGEAFSPGSQVVPVVSREHLQRQLKAWVDEGRLVKAARNCFTLPEQPA